MLGADFYETEAEVASVVAEGRAPVGIGENTKIKWEQAYTKPSLSFKHTRWNCFLFLVDS